LRHVLARLALLAALLLVVAALWLRATPSVTLHLDAPLTFEVEPGTNFTEVLQYLADRGVVTADRRVRLWARVSGAAERIHAGEYRLRPGASVGTLVERLVRGDVLQRRVTLIEGWTFARVRVALAAAPKLEPVTRNLSDGAVMARLGRGRQSPEGRFFPDTYVYTAGTTDLDVLERAYTRMADVLAREWRRRDRGLPYDGPKDALIVASLIEKETGIEGDRDKVAAVFVNRLERNMPLQTDPSVIYGLGESFDGDLTREDLRTPHPWNTYVHRGVPPTPIALPGLASIRAALHPAPLDALYFVARGDGTTVFSRTLEAHRAAVRRYQLGEAGAAEGDEAASAGATEESKP